MNCGHCAGSFRVVRETRIKNLYQGICGFCRRSTWFKGPIHYNPTYPELESEPKFRLNFSEMLILAKIAQLEINL